jgi:hypothetical protein
MMRSSDPAEISIDAIKNNDLGFFDCSSATLPTGKGNKY